MKAKPILLTVVSAVAGFGLLSLFHADARPQVSCGALVHNGLLILPYAVSDTASRFATVDLDCLLERNT